jgi:hypothetical protein
MVSIVAVAVVLLLPALSVMTPGTRWPDGSWAELAAPGSARIAIVGPYLAAAVHALPQAPTGYRSRHR